MIFVFGSNAAGRHGKGAALEARKNHGAIYGMGVGRQGSSYAIPTKDFSIKTMPLEAIKLHVAEFIEYAKTNLDLEFYVTRVGCGLAGYADRDIAPMFFEAPKNCKFHQVWEEIHREMRDGKSQVQADRPQAT